MLTLVFLICVLRLGYADSANEVLENKSNYERSFFSLIGDKLELKFVEYTEGLTNWLEEFNDNHIGSSELGRVLHYAEIKPKVDVETARASRMKKMTMAMMPLIFHVGATSTWMLLTAIMAAKSVAIGLALLVFKIAVSSAKLAAFFTALKGKQGDDHHHGWSWSPPHYEHHGHKRSFSEIGLRRSVGSRSTAITRPAESRIMVKAYMKETGKSARPMNEHPVEYHAEPPVEHHIEHPVEHHLEHPVEHHDWHSYSPEWTPNSNEVHEAPEYHTIPISSKHGEKDIEVKDFQYADRKKSVDIKYS